MFERFSNRARAAVVSAEKEARLLGSDVIRTEHLVLGLLSEGKGVAFKALEAHGVERDSMLARIKRLAPTDGESPPDLIPFTPSSKKVLELSLREALKNGNNYIGTGHVLLGVLREGNGLGAQLLEEVAGLLRTRVREVLDEDPVDVGNGDLEDRYFHPDGKPPPVSGREVTTSLVDAVDLVIVDSSQMGHEQQAALVRSAEVLLQTVRVHLMEGDWSQERGFDYGVEEDVQADADFLGREFARLSDELPNVAVVAQLESRLQRALLKLVPANDVDQSRLQQFKDKAVDAIGRIDGVDDLDDAIAAVDYLVFATRWQEEYDSEREAAWLAFTSESSDPYEVFGRAMGWLVSTEATVEAAARSTGLIATAVANGLALGTAATTEVAVTAAMAVATGSVAILTSVVASVVWYLKARLQPGIRQIPTSADLE